MPRGDKWPSRWWFWSVPILANVYLALAFAVFWAVRSGAFTGVFTGRLRIFLHSVERAFYVPVGLFARWLLGPLMEVLNVDDGLLSLPGNLAIFIGAWEVCAVAGGLVCYGAVALICAVVPGQGGKGNQGDGSR